MRVIAGTARRLQLKTIEGLETRPTTDRIKETLFNMLQPHLYDCRFLDLFAGSGAIGIEALSRGAREAVFVEQNNRAAACIRENLEHTRLADKAQVLQTDVLSAIGRLKGLEPFDYIFMDPPYGKGLELSALEALKHADFCDSNTELILETAIDADTAELTALGYEVLREKIYKTNKHVFLACEKE